MFLFLLLESWEVSVIATPLPGNFERTKRAEVGWGLVFWFGGFFFFGSSVLF